MTTATDRARELAHIVRSARKRVFWCDRHNQPNLPHADYCVDCHLETKLSFQVRSLAAIMRA